MPATTAAPEQRLGDCRASGEALRLTGNRAKRFGDSEQKVLDKRLSLPPGEGPDSSYERCRTPHRAKRSCPPGRSVVQDAPVLDRYAPGAAGEGLKWSR